MRSGIFLGIENRINKKFSFSAYADFWRHNWLKFNISKPSTGYEFFSKFEYRKKRKLSTYIQFFYESKEQNFTAQDQHFKSTGIQERKKLRLHFNNRIQKGLELRTRLEFNWFKTEIIKGSGFLLFQDIIYRPLLSPFSFTTRFSLFDTDSYDNRIFAYENSVLHEFAIPSYSGQGFRYYINLRYKIYPHITVEARFARSHKTRSDNLRSGLDEINGDSESQFKFQLRYQF